MITVRTSEIYFLLKRTKCTQGNTMLMYVYVVFSAIPTTSIYATTHRCCIFFLFCCKDIYQSYLLTLCKNISLQENIEIVVFQHCADCSRKECKQPRLKDDLSIRQ